MPELTREEKLKLVEKLSQRLQDFLYSEDTGAFLLYLGQKYNLPDEKVRLLSKLVADVVLRIVPITSLAQEINSKITSDAQAAMNLAQELNTELLAPVMAPAPSAPATPVLTPAPTTPKTTPTQSPPYQGGEKEGVVDEYREPTFSVPEIVDLRKIPPSPAKAGYGGQRPPVDREGGPSLRLPVAPAPSLPPKQMTVPPAPAPAPAPAPQPKAGPPRAETSPLTFTRPIEPPKPTAPTIPAPQPVYVDRPPLIEAEPHLPAKISPEISAGKIPPSAPRPQYIMRPSGLPPTDLPDNVLDLRKDKGEF